jgi:iron complex transport system substrate-binding protein
MRCSRPSGESADSLLSFGMRSSRKTLRIVSLAPSSTSILCSIGAAKTLVGVSKWCADVASVAHLPKFGDCWHIDDVNAIQALHPDLVIGSVPFRAEALDKLLAAPLNFLALNPRSLGDIERDIFQLGGITGCTAPAQRLVQKMRETFAIVAKRTRRQPRLRVYAEAWPKPRIASPGWVAELIEVAGGELIVKPGARVSEEDVARGNPEVILLAWAATGSRAKTGKTYALRLWQNTPALRLRRVFVVQDELLNTPGPPLIQGIKELDRIFAICRKGDASS